MRGARAIVFVFNDGDFVDDRLAKLRRFAPQHAGEGFWRPALVMGNVRMGGDEK